MPCECDCKVQGLLIPDHEPSPLGQLESCAFQFYVLVQKRQEIIDFAVKFSVLIIALIVTAIASLETWIHGYIVVVGHT